MYTDLRWEGLRVENYLEDPGVEGTMILKWIFKTWDGGMDWIDRFRRGKGGGLL